MTDEQFDAKEKPAENYVLGFMFSPNRRFVALIQKQKPEWQAGKWNGIGGKIETTDTSPIYAMCREFYEETGVDTVAANWFPVAIGCYEGGHVFIYAAENEQVWKVEPKTAETPDIFRIQDLKYGSDIIPNLRYLIPLCQAILAMPAENRPMNAIPFML